MQTSQPSVPKFLKQDEVSQECRDLLSSLRTGKGWVASTFYKYQGFWHPARHLQGVLSCQKHFEAQETDIVLVTTPKSGTQKIHWFSLWHFTNKLRLQEMGTNSLEEAFEKFCRGVSLYGPFWDHVLGYWKESLKSPETVLLLKYEDMKEQPGLQLRKLAKFLGCPYSVVEEKEGRVEAILGLCSFDNLSNLKVNKEGKLLSGEENNVFFRRGEVGDWRNYLTTEMVKQLDKISEEKLRESGLRY